MSDHSGIEWTDATWNPVTGCTKVSAGCDHCYAETFAERWRGVPGHHFTTGFDLTLRPGKLALPLSWRIPRRIFVNSMSDLFHTDVPDDYIAAVFAVMATAHQHTYQVLTKRHARMRALLTDTDFGGLLADHVTALGGPADATWPLRNVWLGVSVEDQTWANNRVPALLRTPAAVRFLSCEPLLGPLDLSGWLGNNHTAAHGTGLDWVIAGGESGPGARPMHPGWVRAVRDQCQAARVPFLFKQWGAWAPTGQRGIGVLDPREQLVGQPDTHGFREVIRRVGKHAAGRILDAHTWDEFPGVAA